VTVPRSDLAHPWDVTPREARAIQERLRRELVPDDRLGRIRRVAGVDVAFPERGRATRAAVAVLDAVSLEVLEQAVVTRATSFPYVPGLLSFREVPAILDALAELGTAPDLLLCDGHGLAHPRRMGLACHLGLVADIPAAGVAKTLLVGDHEGVPDERGAWTALRHEGETVGAVLRSRAGVRPIYVSPGHRIGLSTAVDRVMRCTTRYRLPETTRRADRVASGRA